MIEEAKKIMKPSGIPEENFWVGSVIDESSFYKQKN